MKLIIGLAMLVAGAATAQAGPTLDAIKARGVMKCGVSGDAPRFSAPTRRA